MISCEKCGHDLCPSYTVMQPYYVFMFFHYDSLKKYSYFCTPCFKKMFGQFFLQKITTARLAAQKRVKLYKQNEHYLNSIGTIFPSDFEFYFCQDAK